MLLCGWLFDKQPCKVEFCEFTVTMNVLSATSITLWVALLWIGIYTVSLLQIENCNTVLLFMFVLQFIGN